jgi:hypothetical protein
MSYSYIPLTGAALTVTISRNDTYAVVTLDGPKTKFEANSDSELLKTETIEDGGRPTHLMVPDGWSGMIDVEKSSDDFSALYAFLESNFYNQSAPVYFTITVNEPNGARTGSATYQFTNVQFHKFKPGTWEKKSTVKASVEWAASERIAA